jgi:hypothetical protein
LRELLDHIAAHHFAAALVPRLLRVVPDITALMRALGTVSAGGSTRSEVL